METGFYKASKNPVRQKREKKGMAGLTQSVLSLILTAEFVYIRPLPSYLLPLTPKS